MKFTISCATFARLAGITGFFEPNTDHEIAHQLSCLRIENKNGHVYAIATNQKIAAVEYIGTTDEKDGAVHIKTDPLLIEQCVKEMPFDSRLEIIYISEILLATIKSTFGYNYPSNAAVDGVPDLSPLNNWRTWLPDKTPNQSKGVMYWNVDHINALTKASPSGQVVFPQFIDIDVPVILRDRKFDNWLGLFMAKPPLHEEAVEPSKLPVWISA